MVKIKRREIYTKNSTEENATQLKYSKNFPNYQKMKQKHDKL